MHPAIPTTRIGDFNNISQKHLLHRLTRFALNDIPILRLLQEIDSAFRTPCLPLQHRRLHKISWCTTEANMGVTNRDASLTTLRRGQLALYTYRKGIQYPAPNPSGTRFEQTPGSMNLGPSAEVSVQSYLGAQLIGQTAPSASCACSTAVTLQGYDKKSPAC